MARVTEVIIERNSRWEQYGDRRDETVRQFGGGAEGPRIVRFRTTT